MTRPRQAYETERALNEYLLLHFGRPGDLCPFKEVPREWLGFHRRLREECLLPVIWPGPTRALDIGCGVGRFTFELGRVADEVVGIDSSRVFIRAARRLAATHVYPGRLQESGARFARRRFVVPPALTRGRVEFRVQDALALADFAPGSFQVVAAINLLCRLPHPGLFLSRLHALLPAGGQLILASPFSWLEEYTAPEEWLDGDEVEARLRPHFRLVRRQELPFIIREHYRKYQLVFSQVRVFRRRGR